MYHPSKAGDSCDGTLVSKEIFPTEEAARRIYGLDTSVIKKNVRPASKVLHALRKASERTTSLRGYCGVPSRLLRCVSFMVGTVLERRHFPSLPLIHILIICLEGIPASWSTARIVAHTQSALKIPKATLSSSSSAASPQPLLLLARLDFIQLIVSCNLLSFGMA